MFQPAKVEIAQKECVQSLVGTMFQNWNFYLLVTSLTFPFPVANLVPDIKNNCISDELPNWLILSESSGPIRS